MWTKKPTAVFFYLIFIFATIDIYRRCHPISMHKASNSTVALALKDSTCRCRGTFFFVSHTLSLDGEHKVRTHLANARIVIEFICLKIANRYGLNARNTKTIWKWHLKLELEFGFFFSIHSKVETYFVFVFLVELQLLLLLCSFFLLVVAFLRQNDFSSGIFSIDLSLCHFVSVSFQCVCVCVLVFCSRCFHTTIFILCIQRKKKQKEIKRKRICLKKKESQ